jgi:hypothetical protein
MKRLVALVMVLCLFISGCASSAENNSVESKTDIVQTSEFDVNNDGLGNVEHEYKSLGDELLLSDLEENIYHELEYSLDEGSYVIDDVSAVYVSKEYLAELSYNSQLNIYFGYTLDEIEAQFDSQKYIFTCDDNGNTIVTNFEDYDDTFEKVVKDVAIGSGVILVCATVSIISGGVGAPSAVTAIFAASAKTGAQVALSGSVLSSAMTAIVTGIQTKDVKQTVSAAALSAGSAFKWGAITGAIIGGVSEGISLAKAAKAENAIQDAQASNNVPTSRESEDYVAEKYGGKKEVSYMEGKEVAYGTDNSTRPDVVVQNADGTLEAIEVKNYALETAANRANLYKSIQKEVSDRVANLPEGSTQKIVLDVRNRGYSEEFISGVVQKVKECVSDIYTDIPVDVLQ